MSLSYTVPTAGSTLNSVADPEVASALNSILSWANGNIQGGDLSPSAAIANSQLGSDAKRLGYTAQAGNYTANLGDWVSISGGLTVTLPSPATKNGLVAVQTFATNAASVTTPSGLIYGPGMTSGASSFSIADGACVLLQADGTNWRVIAGQPDTGWVALALSGNITAATGYNTPASRVIGDRVLLRGGLWTTAVSFSAGSTLGTVQSLARPSEPVIRSVAYGSISGPPQMFPLMLDTSGNLTYGSTISTDVPVSLNGVSYSL